MRELIREQIEFRDFLYQMTRRDLVFWYKQTVMGFGWVFFQFLANLLIFTVVFICVVLVETGALYSFFVCCGLVLWTFFALSVRFVSILLTTNVQLVTKVYFLREIFLFVVVIVCFVDFFVVFSLIVALMVWYGVFVSPAFVVFSFVVVVHVVLTLALLFILFMAIFYFRDVKYLLEMALSFWMFVFLILYFVDRVGGIAGKALAANPFTLIIDAYRAILIRGELSLVGLCLTVGAILLGFLVAVWLTFHRAELDFAEAV